MQKTYNIEFRDFSRMQSLSHDNGIYLILGPMFAGKSTELIRRVRKYRAAGRYVFVIKHSADTRYSESSLATHDIYDIPAIPTSTIAQVVEYAMKYDVIAIDEGQFYPDIVEYAEQLANLGKIVIITALDGNFMRKPFAVIPPLCSLAETVDKLSAVCYKCHRDAAFSGRVSNQKDEVVIGGADMYVACCRACWYEIEEAKKASECSESKPSVEAGKGVPLVSYTANVE